MPNQKHNKKRAATCNRYTLLPDIVVPPINLLDIVEPNNDNKEALNDKVYQRNY